MKIKIKINGYMVYNTNYDLFYMIDWINNKTFKIKFIYMYLKRNV